MAGGLAPAFSSAHWQKLLQDSASTFTFDLQLPFGDLPKKAQNQIIYGKPVDGRPSRTAFAGIVPLLRLNYQEATSESYREWLMQFMSAAPCETCKGKRLRAESLAVRIQNYSIADLTDLPVEHLAEIIGKIVLREREAKVADRVVEEIRVRLNFLLAVGLGYLTLDRPAPTLSGGESQRIRLAAQIGSKLRGVLYILDEPSIGLHHRDNERLLHTLRELRDLGNTVLVVEHDAETIRQADYVVDLGPGAGRHGGYLVAAGSPRQIAETESSLTGQYLSGRKANPIPAHRRSANGKWLTIHQARANNLKNIDASFPLGLLTVITGVSGSGKSTLVNDILYRALAQKLYRAKEDPGSHGRIEGTDQIDKIICIDQSPIGRTPRSNPATYTGVFSPIRDLFARLPESRERGYQPGRFSFNVRGGRCESCQGDGQRRIEMNFLPDVFVTCDICRGRRYNEETLAVQFKGRSIADILESTVEEALPILENIPAVKQKLQTLADVGLGYLHLGQSSTTLSGGEAQRIKLARELSRRQTGRTMYILDEPTTGLHFYDVGNLLEVLIRLTDLGNTVIIIEHNLDVIKTADWVIDLGPEGGGRGGELVACGTPEFIAQSEHSYTGQALRAILPSSSLSAGTELTSS